MALSVHAADAVPISFTATIEGASRNATVEEIVLDGVPFVSIVSVAEQFGGAVSLLTTRVRVDAAGSTAWIQADDTRVNAFRIFTLSQPAKRVESDFLIATADVPTFFENAFRVTVVRSASPETMGDLPPVPAAVEGEAAPVEAAPAPAAVPRSAINVIVIDPGHGGFDSGLEGAGGVLEKTLVLDVAVRIKSFLESKTTQTVVLTRDEDLALNEEQRSTIAQNSSADLVLMLHSGSSLSPKVRGSMVLYESGSMRVAGRAPVSRDEARRLAGLIAESLKGVPAVPIRGLDYVETRAIGPLAVPAVMVEIGCLTSPEDAAALADESVRALLASAIGTGMLRFLGVSEGGP